MLSIYDLKELAVTDTPLLLFQCVLPNGQAEYWSTHGISYDGNTYAPRVMKHNLFEVQTSSDQGVDAIPRVSVAMANADSYFSEVERSIGWKGATLTVRFVFYSLLDRRCDIGRSRSFSRYCQPARSEHRVVVPAFGRQPDEHAAGAVAAGPDPTAVPLAVSGYGRAEAGGVDWGGARAILAILCLRIFSRFSRRLRQFGRRRPLHLVLIYPAGL